MQAPDFAILDDLIARPEGKPGDSRFGVTALLRALRQEATSHA